MAEIGKADHNLFADGKKVVDEGDRFVNLLQGLADDDVVKAVRRIISHLQVKIPLEHGKTLADADGHLGLIFLDAGGLDPFLLLEILEQLPFAAAQIKHP